MMLLFRSYLDYAPSFQMDHFFKKNLKENKKAFV